MIAIDMCFVLSVSLNIVQTLFFCIFLHAYLPATVLRDIRRILIQGKDLYVLVYIKHCIIVRRIGKILAICTNRVLWDA